MHIYKVRILCAALSAALLCALFSGCVPEKAESAVDYRFDTVITINAYCSRSILDGALSECARYEALLSKTVEGSDVWRINHAGGSPVEVSDETAEVLETALAVSRASDGAFDITTEPESALWDFTSESPSLPSEAALSEAAKKTDWTKLSLSGNTVTLPAEMSVDLGGAAKGYIADKIAEYLAENGVKCAVLNFGGNVLALGKKPDGTPWRIGIQKPYGETGEYVSLLEIPGGAAVTSGVYERGFDLDGVRYHHLLDPETGYPVQNGLASVTVFCESSALADALSTAAFVLGREKGAALLAEFGAEGAFLSESGELFLTDGLQ